MSQPGSPERALYDRVVALLGAHDVHPEDRDTIREALVPGATWETIPDEVRALIEQLEKELPRQSWDDPADVPDHIFSDAGVTF